MTGQPDAPLSSIQEIAHGTWIKLSTAFITQLRRLKGAKALVWLAIALRINEEHVSFPSIARICEDTGYSNREVIDTLRELEESGFLTIRRGDHKYNTYRVNHSAAFGESRLVIPTCEETSPVNFPTVSVNFSPESVKLDATKMLKTSLKQESINKIKQDERYNAQNEFQKVWNELEQFFGAVAPDTAQLIEVWLEKHPLERIHQAISVARDKRAGSPKYVDQVLITWEANGYPPTREEQVLSRAFKPAKGNNENDQKRYQIPNYSEADLALIDEINRLSDL